MAWPYAPSSPPAKRCASCGAAFTCGASGPAPCWCAALPPLPPLPDLADCLCPTCLARALEAMRT